MRILHVISSLDPNAGGPPAVALRLAAAQAALGASVAILAYADPTAAERTRASLAGIPGIDRVEMISVAPPSGLRERVLAPRAAAAVRGVLPRFDVLHIHGIWDSMLRVAAREAWHARVPYAVVPHGMLDPWCLGNTPAKRVKKHAALATAYRGMLAHAAFLHTLNRDERDLMAPLRLRPPAEVLPNGVFLDELSNLPAPGAFRVLHPAIGPDPYILFLSRLHHKKGLDYLADAFARLVPKHATLRLVVAGPDDGALTPFSDQCRRLGVEARVHAVGPLYGAAKLAAFVDAAVFCLPSRQEGFSMAVTEAMACGVPVVVSDQCHFPEVAEAGAGRVTGLSAAATAEGLESVLSDPGARAAMGRAGRALVEARFTWPAIARASIEAYHRRGVKG